MEKNSCACGDMELLISMSVDGECSTADRERLRAHLSSCPECRSVRDEYERVQSLLERTVSMDAALAPPLPDVSGLLDDFATKKNLRVVDFRRRGVRLAFSAAASLLLFFSGHSVGALRHAKVEPATPPVVEQVPQTARLASAYVVSAPSMWVSARGGEGDSSYEAQTEKPFVERINRYRSAIGEQLRTKDVDWEEIRRLVEAMGELRTDLELLTLHMAYLDIRTGSPASQVAKHWESMGESPFGRSAKQ